jgi:hypothetical protein
MGSQQTKRKKKNRKRKEKRKAPTRWARPRQDSWASRQVRLSPTSDPYGHPNAKCVLDGTVSASNRVLICETYFRLQERHNPNMSILSPRDSFTERVLF